MRKMNVNELADLNRALLCFAHQQKSKFISKRIFQFTFAFDFHSLNVKNETNRRRDNGKVYDMMKSI